MAEAGDRNDGATGQRAVDGLAPKVPPQFRTIAAAAASARADDALARFAVPAQGFDNGRPSAQLALVFGREDCGLYAEEVAACDAVVSVPMGRLAESLSLPMCATLALGALYELRTRRDHP